MPLKKFWKRLMFRNSEVEFQALKSRSAVELSSYNKKQRSPNERLHRLPRFYSHYDSFQPSPVVVSTSSHQNQEQRNVGDDLYYFFNTGNTPPNLMDADIDDVCVVFCHSEVKQTSLLESLTLEKDDLDTNSNAFSAEPTLNAVLAVCHDFRDHPHFREGLLLKSVESQNTFPYVHYAMFDKIATEKHSPFALYRSTLKSAVSQALSTMLGVYEEVSSMIHKSKKLDSRLPTNRYTGYVVVGFKVMNNEQLDEMATNWLQWSGAKDLYRCSPKAWNLKRMTFHRMLTEPNNDGFVFVLLCEFANMLHPDNVVMACDMVERLKQRYCGHVGLYKAQWSYTKLASSKKEWEKFDVDSNEKSKKQIVVVPRSITDSSIVTKIDDSI